MKTNWTKEIEKSMEWLKKSKNKPATVAHKKLNGTEYAITQPKEKKEAKMESLYEKVEKNFIEILSECYNKHSYGKLSGECYYSLKNKKFYFFSMAAGEMVNPHENLIFVFGLSAGKKYGTWDEIFLNRDWFLEEALENIREY